MMSNCVRTLLRRVSSRTLLEHSEKCVAMCAHFALGAISFSRILFLNAATFTLDAVWLLVCECGASFAWFGDDIKAICKAKFYANYYYFSRILSLIFNL